MTNVTAIQQAKYAFERKTTASRETRVSQVIELAEWKLFSNRQISTFTGISPSSVKGFTGKTDRTGGELEGAALGPILEVIANKAKGEVNDAAVRRALEAGTSSLVLAKLTEIPPQTLRRWAKRAGYEAAA